MSLMIHDTILANDILARRRAAGADRYDEVWEGVYVMSPLANNEHQGLVTQLSIAIGTVVDWQDLGRTLAGANVSDRRDEFGGWISQSPRRGAASLEARLAVCWNCGCWGAGWKRFCIAAPQNP